MPSYLDNNDDEVVFLNPFTCGIYKDGGARYKIDPRTGKRTNEVDNELIEHVEQLIVGNEAPGTTRISLEAIYTNRVLVPRYYDNRWLRDFHALISRENLKSISLGELEDKEVILVRGGHGSPSNDNRRGHIPYVKVSDIRSLRINVNPTNLVTSTVAESFWRGKDSGIRSRDLITPNRASSNIGEFAIILPGEEQVVITKEVFVIRVLMGIEEGWDPFYLLWALCLTAVRKQWQRVALMQTNREDVGNRYREILIPKPRNREWAQSVSGAFRDYFTTLAESKTKFVARLANSGYDYIASAYSTGSTSFSDEETTNTDEDEPHDDSND